jgi:ABC-type glutathione transport system ATPase component
MNQPRIEVTDLVVRYGDVTAVDGIGFDIAPGELVTLLGPSGCGKLVAGDGGIGEQHRDHAQHPRCLVVADLQEVRNGELRELARARRDEIDEH